MRIHYGLVAGQNYNAELEEWQVLARVYHAYACQPIDREQAVRPRRLGGHADACVYLASRLTLVSSPFLFPLGRVA
jgi:hypothetical protein